MRNFSLRLQSWCSGAVYTMDHELVPRPYEACDWMLNSSQEHFGLHQAKNVREPIDFEVPKKQYLSPILFTNMVQRFFRWEGQKRWSGKTSRVPWQKNAKKKLIIFYLLHRNRCRLLLKQTNGLILGHNEKAVLWWIFHFSFLQYSSNRVIEWDFFLQKYKDISLTRDHIESHKESGHKIQSECNEYQMKILERIKIQFPKCCKVQICSPVLLVHFILVSHNHPLPSIAS